MSARLLAVDVGTQSVRAIVFDAAGEMLAKAQIPIEAYFSEQPGWAEKWPEDYWQAMCEACVQLWSRGDVRPESVSGVALTTQRGTVVNVDEKGRVLRPAMVWLDQRRTSALPPVGGLWGWLFKLVGVGETIRRLQAEAESNWIRTHQPEIWRQTRKYLLLSGYLNYRLVGEFRDSVGSQVGYIPFDYKRLRWASGGDWRWRAMGVEPDLMPELVPPGERLGALTESAATDLGLPAGLPVVAAAADKACEVLGAGVFRPGTACLSFGTTATINTLSHRYLEVVRFLPAYPAALPGCFNTELQIYRGFWLVSWFKRQFAQHEQAVAQRRGIAPEALLDELLADIPPGTMGLMLQPFWSPGVREPGPEAKGAVIGFGDVHTRAHFYRAILEGLAYALREGRERIEKRTRTGVSALKVAGGGSQSDAAMQVAADVFGLPATRAHVYETSALGAAISLAVGLGVHPDFETAAAAMTRDGRVFHPRPEAHRLYDALYRRVYKRMYGRLKPLYEEIREITGYPD